MAVASDGYRYLFILNPRTASTALANGVLIPYLGGKWIPGSDMVMENGSRVPRKHTTLDQLLDAEIFGVEELRRYHVFVGVRNPFDSLVSLYTKIVSKYSKEIERNPDHFYLENPRAREEARAAVEGGFDAWMAQKYGGKVGSHVLHFHAKWVEGAHSYLRFEHITEDFRELCDRLGMPQVEIPAMNVTAGRKNYREYYSSESRNIVESLFKPTLDQFDYAF